jgi:NAD(P)-dependent dehydrogenase (short-subunit alcohol dehydrogenase family)
MSAGERINQIDLNNRHAVVTGAAQGIGFAITRRLLASGASVSLWDRDGEALSSARQQLDRGGLVSTETVDIADPASVEAATHATLQEHGPSTFSWPMRE